jgi:glutamyl/glutaminyl-tRNA synthetase
LVKKLDETGTTLLKTFQEKLSNSDKTISAEDFHQLYEQICADLNIKSGQYMQLLRVVVTGQGAGPSLWEILALISTPYVIDRFNVFFNKRDQKTA